jgi:hypothetical protein
MSAETSPQDALLRYPAQIRKERLELWEAKQDAERARFRLRMMEAEALASIAAAHKAAGTRSSESTREAEVSRRLENEPEANHLRKSITEAELLAHRIETHIEYLEDVQRNGRVLLLSQSASRIFFEESQP